MAKTKEICYSNAIPIDKFLKDSHVFATNLSIYQHTKDSHTLVLQIIDDDRKLEAIALALKMFTNIEVRLLTKNRMIYFLLNRKHLFML